MSSEAARTQITDFLTTNSTETFLDISGVYDDMQDFLVDSGVGPSDNWVALQFIGDNEEPITIDADGTKGKYRESGSVLLHVVAPVGFGIVPAIMGRAETLRNLLRGKRIGDIIIESVTPANFGFGAALQFEGGYTAATFICAYERDFDL